MYGAYKEDLADWILEYKSHLLPVTRWLFAQGLDIPDYVTHLANDGACDGLKIWLVSALSETPLNIVQEDTVLSMAKLGIDFAFPTIMLTLVGYGLLCEPEPMTIFEDETFEPLPNSLVTWHGRHPISKEYVQLSTSTTASESSSGTETETEQLIEAPEREYKMPAVGGVAK